MSAPSGIPSVRTIAMPSDANPNGDIFGGWIMSQMDLAGGTYAFAIAGGRVTTVAVDGMTFHRPVQIGDQVSRSAATARQSASVRPLLRSRSRLGCVVAMTKLKSG